MQFIDLFVKTAGSTDAASDGEFEIEIDTLIGGITENRAIVLQDLAGDEMSQNQGDWWSIYFPWFGFPGCVTPTDITRVSILARNGQTDNWIIDSIITVGYTDKGNRIFLTANYAYNGDSYVLSGGNTGNLKLVGTELHSNGKLNEQMIT